MNLYSQCTPKPVGVPLPVRQRAATSPRFTYPVKRPGHFRLSVTFSLRLPQLPVPMFLPVTMDSAERIVETIQEIKEKIPSDPFEAELILMAEMVAEQDDKKEKEERPKEKVSEKERERQAAPAPDGRKGAFLTG